MGGRSDSKELIEGLRQWIIALSKVAPVMISIDDLHWASNSVLELFARLAQDAKKAPILLVGIFRTFEMRTEDSIGAALLNIARTGRLVRFELSQLSETETIKLITTSSGKLAERLKEEDKSRLYMYSSGVPLYAVELTHFLEEGNLELLGDPRIEGQPDFENQDTKTLVPPLISTITRLRLSNLPAEDQKLLKDASLLLGNIPYPLLLELSDAEPGDLENMLLKLENRNFLNHIEVHDAVEFRFTHRMIKLAIAQNVSTLERRRFYSTLIDILKSSDFKVTSDAMAYYVFLSGDRLGSIPMLLSSANTWLLLGDTQKGLMHSNTACRIALENLQSDAENAVPVILNHTNNLVSLGKFKEALDVYNEAISQLEKDLASKHKPELLQLRDLLKGKLKEEPVSVSTPPGTLALLTMRRAMANTRLMQGDIKGALDLITSVEKDLEDLPPDPSTMRETGMTLQIQGKICFQTDKYSETIRLTENALTMLATHGTRAELIETERLLAMTFLKMENYKKTREALKRCRNYLQLYVDAYEQMLCDIIEARIHFAEGDLVNSEALLKNALRACELTFVPKSVEFDAMIELVRIKVQNERHTEALDLANSMLESDLTDVTEDSVNRLQEIRAKLLNSKGLTE